MCRCVSPKNGRVGKLRPAYGEYGALGKALAAFSLSRVPTSVCICASTGTATPAAVAAAIFMKSRRLMFFAEFSSDFFFAIVSSILFLLTFRGI